MKIQKEITIVINAEVDIDGKECGFECLFCSMSFPSCDLFHVELMPVDEDEYCNNLGVHGVEVPGIYRCQECIDNFDM